MQSVHPADAALGADLKKPSLSTNQDQEQHERNKQRKWDATASDRQQGQQRGDPSHTQDLKQIMVSGFQDMQTWGGKVMYVLVMVVSMLLYVIPNVLSFKLGLRGNNGPRRFRLRRVVPSVWIGEYHMPAGTSYCVIIRGRDNSLFIRSPPEPTANILQTIRDEGDPSAILLTASHDTHADKWKQLFPQAKILAPECDRAMISDRVPVDMTLEESADLLKNFYIVDTLSTADWMRHDEPVLLVQSETDSERRITAVFGCGVENNVAPLWSVSRWRDEVTGRARLRVVSQFAYAFVTSPIKAQLWWQHLASLPQLEALVFLHGDPIIGVDNVRSAMLEVNMRNMRLAQ